MKKRALFFAAALAALSATAQTTGPLVLHSPQDYYLTGVSSNGKWACGTYSNGNNMLYAFRWNLETNETELLSGDDIESQADRISDDGIVVGTFEDTEATVNGAPVLTAGYWKDGRWHHLPNIDNAWVTSMEGVGYANTISRNGKYIAGAYNDANGVCIPVIWEEGKILHTFGGSGYEEMIYDVTEDGQMATGWIINKASGGARVAALWKVGESEPTLLMDAEKSNAWCYGRRFSPDGKKILYWEQYYDVPANEITDPNASNMGLIAVYDVATGEKTGIPTLTRDPWHFELFDIDDAGTVVGFESLNDTQEQRAVIYKDGQTQWMEDYLLAQGVDLEKEAGNILMQSDSIHRYISQAKGISNDGNTLGVIYYDTVGAYCAMVVKMNENLSTREPVGLSASRLAGLQAAKLSWKKPLAGADGVKGYNIYRNGVKVNAAPVTALSYIDNSDELQAASYDYYVTAVYENVESAPSYTASLSMEKQTAEAPRSLFARQRRYNDAIVQWIRPMSNLVVKSYVGRTDEITGFGGGSNSFEAAIRYSQEEMALYRNDHKITSVSFYPMSEQTGWTVNIYRRASANAALELLHTQPVTQTLAYGVENVVTLSAPVEIPAEGDIYVAVSVTVPSTASNYNVIGEVYGKVEPEYSDLIRMTSEPDFYSLYVEGQKLSLTQQTAWAIGMILSPEGVAADVDVVSHYNVYDGEAKLGETENLSFVATGLADGTHTLGVEAVYAGGTISSKETIALDIVPNAAYYKSITPRLTVSGEGYSLLTAEWDAPMDDDATVISYAGDELQGGVIGAEANNFSYMAAAEYTPSMMQGYEGYQVTGFRFFPLSKADFTFFLKVNGETVREQWVENYTLNEWNTVLLDEPLTVDESASYLLSLDCYDVIANQAPLGIDKHLPFVGLSDIYSQDDGVNYASVTQSSVYGNWMLGMVVTAPNSVALPVEGYDVKIDGVKQNSDLLTATTYTHDFGAGADGTHRISVDVHYPVQGKVSGTALFFAVGAAAGVDEHLVADLHVQQGENFVTVMGEGITSVKAVNMAGQSVASAQGNVLDITGLPAGVYVLRIEVQNAVKTMKIQIVH